MNENKQHTIYQILYDAVKTGLAGKFIATSAYVNKQEGFQISNLALQLKKLEKE